MQMINVPPVAALVLRRFWIPLFVFWAFVPIMAGCGDSGNRVDVHPVSGKVLHRGGPATGAKVVLYATERPDSTTPFPSAVVQPDGSFTLTSYTVGDGAPAGKYKVTVVWPEPIPPGVHAESHSPADRLGGRYSNPDQSKLEVTVTEGENELEPFNLQ